MFFPFYNHGFVVLLRNIKEKNFLKNPIWVLDSFKEVTLFKFCFKNNRNK